MTLTAFLLARIAEDKQRWTLAAMRTGGSALLKLAERMLAECDAKRRIVELEPPATGDGGFPEGYWEAHQLVLRLLALPYAGHPDYEEAWRP